MFDTGVRPPDTSPGGFDELDDAALAAEAASLGARLAAEADRRGLVHEGG
jgi:hypothetical protein